MILLLFDLGMFWVGAGLYDIQAASCSLEMCEDREMATSVRNKDASVQLKIGI
ncbi:MAG: hypothetical protein Q8L53_17505 [Aestuariivirga sp.]|nr:hypothetical protein [Aestuariivirga sp.]